MMVKYIVLSISLLFLMTCDKEETDCAAVSCLAQTFAIEYVDAAGNNLIENGTYSLSDIIVSKDGLQLNNAQQVPSTSELQFFLYGEEGDNNYTINFNNNEADTLLLNLSLESKGGECCPSLFNILKANYNNIETEIQGETYATKISVVKP